jgi:phenylalanyl-tRNA synthetase beta chain
VRICLAWLRELVAIEEDPVEVARALTARGLPVDAIERAGSETVFVVDVPANRPDCLGHLGVAREIGAAFGRPLRPRSVPPPPFGAPVSHELEARIEDDELCPRYTAGLVRSVTVRPSPPWVVSRLEACGLRPVNNVVDASNLVLLELGHPIHTFDFDRIEGRRILVRRALAGESLRTLDGVERSLDPSMLVIADARRPVAIAGVMGGSDTEIGPTTRNVLIEAACFEPRQVRRTARTVGLVTEASQRFERGVDPEGVLEAQSMAARLLRELAGGVPAPGPLDLYPRPRPLRRVRLRPERLRTLVGFDPGAKEIEEALGSLGIVTVRDGDSFEATVPSWRVDLEREADLVEEVLRQLGYDRIPAAVPATAPAVRRAETVPVSLEERARDLLAQLGFHEALSYAMIGPGEDDPFVAESVSGAVRLSNPLSEGSGCLRRSLVPGLLAAVGTNLRRRARDVRLFEVGRVFYGSENGVFPREPSHVGIAWTGAAEPPHWSRRTREVDLYDMAGIVERLLGFLRPRLELPRHGLDLPGIHPARGIAWGIEPGNPVAWCGQLHPEREHALDLRAPVFLAEVDLEALGQLPTEPVRFRPVSRFPAVSRDLSFVVGSETPFGKLVAALRDVPAPDGTVRFELVDRYEGEPLRPTEVSFSVRFWLEPRTRTLTDEEIETYRLALVEAVEKEVGGRLRS